VRNDGVMKQLKGNYTGLEDTREIILPVLSQTEST
jgi:hypothetical protein